MLTFTFVLFVFGDQVELAEEETVYVRPGGGKETWEWAHEDMHVIWEVPWSSILEKVGLRVRTIGDTHACVLSPSGCNGKSFQFAAFDVCSVLCSMYVVSAFLSLSLEL